jgi:hypothetical protein
MEKFEKERQKRILEVACKANEPEVWEEALSSEEMFFFFLKHPEEVSIFIKDYGFPRPLIKKLREVHENSLSSFLF